MAKNDDVTACFDRIETLVLYAAPPESSTLSYQLGWPQAFAADDRFESTLIDVLAFRDRVPLRLRRRLRRFELIVVLHSAFSNARFLTGPLYDALCAAHAVKAYFVGNEYKLMPEKMAFAEELGIGLLVSMTANPRVHDLYRQRLRCVVASIPSGGVDPTFFSPRKEREERLIDIGFRAHEEPPYFGHQDRRSIAERFSQLGESGGLRLDLSFSPHDRFERVQWGEFLNDCKAQLGTEGGTDFFDLEDRVRNDVNAYVDAHPDSTIDELWQRFFSQLKPMPARMITGRQSEAAATKTTQIMFKGDYNGFFLPDRHYIALEKDFANLSDVLDRLADESFCREIAENAYEVALSELTYERLLDRFCLALAEVPTA